MAGIREFTLGRRLVWAALFAAGAISPRAVAGAEPEEKVTSLLRRAERGPSEQRSKALEELGRISDKAKVRDHRVSEFLLRLAADGKELLRLRKKAIEAVVALARDVDPSIREQALDTLVKILERGGEEATLRRTAAGEMWALVNPESLGIGRRAVSALEAAASGGEPSVLRVAALKSLGRIGASGSLNVIRTALRDGGEPVALAAMEALEEYLKKVDLDPKDRSVLGRLMADLIEDRSRPRRIRALAVKILARMRYAAASRKIADLLEKENDSELVLAGLEALSILSDPLALETIVKVYARFGGADGSRVRSAACAALGDLYHPLAKARAAAGIIERVTDCLVRALSEDESADVARSAAWGLGNLAACGKAPREKAVEALIDALTDPDGVVRDNAVYGLEELTLHRIDPLEDESPEGYQERWRTWFADNREQLRS